MEVANVRYKSTSEETEQLSITIYNGGFGLVKEQRTFGSEKECTEVQYIDVAKRIEIDSIIVNGLQILRHDRPNFRKR